MMRAMALEFPNDREAVAVEDQFMLGPDVLIAPILEPGATERRVYLPKGEWADLWTGMSTTAGWVTAPTPPDAIPVYIRGGSCIPLWMPEVVELGAPVGLPGEGPGHLVLMVAAGESQSDLVDPISGRTWSVKVVADDDALVVTAIGAPETVTVWLRDGSGQERLVPISQGDSSLVIGPETP